MVATHTANSNLLHSLRQQLPDVDFVAGKTFAWHSAARQIEYPHRQQGTRSFAWDLLHESAHALLEHREFSSALDLLSIELAAWEHAKQLAPSYGLTIPQEYIEQCLDSYREQLHQTSICRVCQCHGLPLGKKYSCPNCGTLWS